MFILFYKNTKYLFYDYQRDTEATTMGWIMSNSSII